MRAQQDREEQAVVIATACGVFMVILSALGLLAWGVQSLTHALDGHEAAIEAAIVWPAVLLAAMVACSHVTRSSRH